MITITKQPSQGESGREAIPGDASEYVDRRRIKWEALEERFECIREASGQHLFGIMMDACSSRGIVRHWDSAGAMRLRDAMTPVSVNPDTGKRRRLPLSSIKDCRIELKMIWLDYPRPGATGSREEGMKAAREQLAAFGAHLEGIPSHKCTFGGGIMYNLHPDHLKDIHELA